MFSFSFKFKTFILQANSDYSDQTPRSVASGLGLHGLPMSRKMNARLLWVNPLYYFCFVVTSALCPSLALLRVCLWSVIVAFPCHTQMCFRNVFP